MAKKGSHLSAATKAKLRAKLKGRKMRPATRQLLSRKRKGKKLSPQTIQKIKTSLQHFRQTGQRTIHKKKPLTTVQLAKLRIYEMKRRLKLHKPAVKGSALHRKRIGMGVQLHHLNKHNMYKRKKPYSHWV